MSTTHNLEVGQSELALALDQRHEIRLPPWDLIELDALGERPPSSPPLAWGGLTLMAVGFGDGGSEPPPDEDWELEALHDPGLDGPEQEYEHVDWIIDPDDWELEELDAVGELPAVSEPLAWSGGAFMAMGFDAGGGGSSEPTPSEDDDWELEQLSDAWDGRDEAEDD